MGTRTHECPRNRRHRLNLAVLTKRLPEPRLVHHFMKLKSQLNVRLSPVCMDLIKLERKNIPGCASDGEALESIIFRAATSPEARQAHHAGRPERTPLRRRPARLGGRARQAQIKNLQHIGTRPNPRTHPDHPRPQAQPELGHGSPYGWDDRSKANAKTPATAKANRFYSACRPPSPGWPCHCQAEIRCQAEVRPAIFSCTRRQGGA